MSEWVTNPVGFIGYGVDTTVQLGPCVDMARDALHVEAPMPAIPPLPLMQAPSTTRLNSVGMDVQGGGSGRAPTAPAHQHSKRVIKAKKIFSPGD